MKYRRLVRDEIKTVAHVLKHQMHLAAVVRTPDTSIVHVGYPVNTNV